MKLTPYKGFEGVVTFVDPEANTLTAEVVNCDAGIHAQAATPSELQREWEASVDAYLAYCAERSIEPMKPFSGVMSLRLGPDLHRQVHQAARLEGKSVNAWIKDTLAKSVGYLEFPTSFGPQAEVRAGGAPRKGLLADRGDRPSAAEPPTVKVVPEAVVDAPRRAARPPAPSQTKTRA